MEPEHEAFSSPSASKKETNLEEKLQAANEELLKLRLKIQNLEQKVVEQTLNYGHICKEFDQFRERIAAERTEWIKYGWDQIASELLEVTENLSRALSHFTDPAHLRLAQALKLVVKQFEGVLTKYGIQEICCTETIYNPKLHEAIKEEDSLLPEGTILREEKRGFMLHKRVLRPSKVVISRGKKNKSN